jgi:hypothetical protein
MRMNRRKRENFHALVPLSLGYCRAFSALLLRLKRWTNKKRGLLCGFCWWC